MPDAYDRGSQLAQGLHGVRTFGGIRSMPDGGEGFGGELDDGAFDMIESGTVTIGEEGLGKFTVGHPVLGRFWGDAAAPRWEL